MGCLNIYTLHSFFVFQLSSIFLQCRLLHANGIQSQSKAWFPLSGVSLRVRLEASSNDSLVQGGHAIIFHLNISYRVAELKETFAQVEQAYQNYCEYVDDIMNNDIYTGGEMVLNCTNATRTLISNYTCNSTDGINCVYNLTANSTVFVGNSSQNQTRNSTRIIMKQVQQNETTEVCVNVTTPLVKVERVLQPLSHFNLSRQHLEIELELPNEFDIQNVQEPTLSSQFNNITLNCTHFMINSSYNKISGKPKVTFQVQFANVSWNGSAVISAVVTERVVPRQLLNITGNVSFHGFRKPLWIGTYTVPGLSYGNMLSGPTSFAGTPGHLLTDEEEIIVETGFVIPSVTTNIQVFIELPVFNGSMPLKIVSARVSNVQGNIQSSNLRPGSGIGQFIVLSEVISLDPSASTLVKFDFGKTSNPPGFTDSSITLQVTGKVDSVRRSDGYVPNSLGNVTSWMVYSTAVGDKNVICPQWIGLKLGQPRLQYEISFTDPRGNVEGGREIEFSFFFYNPAYATESSRVVVNLSFAKQYTELVNSSVSVCNVTLDTSSPLGCQIASLWPPFSITNTSSTFHVEFGNLTAGFGVFGRVVSTVLSSVPASEAFQNLANIAYNRQGWLLTEDQTSLTAQVKPIKILSTVVFSSVESSSQYTVTIGEKTLTQILGFQDDFPVWYLFYLGTSSSIHEVTFFINGTIPITTNQDFAIVIGSASISYEKTNFIYVGDNIVGKGIKVGTELNVTSGFIPEAAKTFSQPVLVGQFGSVNNSGKSSAPYAATFTVQVSFYMRDIPTNINNRVINVPTMIYHHPGRKYQSDQYFKIVEPEITASVVVSPDKNVQQNSVISFTATIKHDSPSLSAAFNLLVQLVIPYPHLTLKEFTSKTGRLRTVPGNMVPRPFLSPENINSEVLIYENDIYQSSSEAIEINYKATTSSTLPSSEFINSSFILFYSSLPKILNQSFARNYSLGPVSEPSFLTFRPDPYLSLTFNFSGEGEFDAGDILSYNINVKNVGVGNVQPKAYTLHISMPLSKTAFKDVTLVCTRGLISNTSSLTEETLLIQQSVFLFNEEIQCNLTMTLNIVVPSQVVPVKTVVTYHCFPASMQHHYNDYYMEEKRNVHIKKLIMELTAGGSTSDVLTGDVLEYNVKITLPEVTTSLRIEFDIPIIASDARGRRSLRQNRAAQLDILKPLLSQTPYSTAGSNLVVTTPTMPQLTPKYVVEFASVKNIPDNVESSLDVLVIQANFSVVDRPLILSGRTFDVLSTVIYPGGSVSQTAKFSVVGPLVKPLLQLSKSFHVIDPNLDSPSGIFYVNISHASGSPSDAYDVNVSDTIEGMSVIRNGEFPGIVISAPANNKYKFESNIPVIAVGQTVHFYYKSQFEVEVKTPKYLQTPATIQWRSEQLNSPAYGPEMNSDACVARNDTVKERHEPLYSFLALGAFLGLVIGFVTIIIAVCIFIKCCNKGRLVPYYRVFAGKSTYHALQEEGDDKQFTATTSTCVQQHVSVIYIISSDDPKKTEKQLENLDIQATMKLDRHLESSRQSMFRAAFERVIGSLRLKRDISEEQSKMFVTKLNQGLDEIAAKNRRELEKRSAELQKKMEAKAEAEVEKLDEKKLKEIEEAKVKLDGADKKKTKELLNMIISYYQSLEQDVQVQIQLEHDLEQEKIRKELSVNNRISSKELQSNLVKEVASEAELTEEDAQKLVADHLHAIAAVEKVHDDEKSRQTMALEMRLAERKALAQEMREQQQQEAQVLLSMKEKYEKVLKNLVNSSQVSETEATAYRDKLLKDVENLDRKLERQRHRQEQNLHDRLTIMKKRKLQEKERELQLELKKLEEGRDNSDNVKEFVLAQQELTQKHNEEMQDLERELDKNAAKDLKELRAQIAEETRKEYKTKIEKYYKELIKKGVLKDDLGQLLDSHDKDVARLVEVQQSQQAKQKIALEEKLKKRRELLTEKMKAEQKEQEKIRTEEQKVLKNMIENQVAISEDEKERILREHEKNMAELESSLTLNKLRQKHMLEQKLEQRRALKMDRLQQKHVNENKRIKIENVDGTTEEVDLLKKQEKEKMELIRNDSDMEDEIEQIREEMLKARMETLQEHNDRLGALIADLQIQRANQIAEINKQQRALGQLQTSILDDLEEKGVLVDPETKEILQQHQDQTQQLEKALQTQREQQEQALKDRLREKLKQREHTLIQEQKDEITKYLDEQQQNSGITRFRKAVLKARHKSQLDEARQQIDKEIEQSVNKMKLQFEISRLKAVEKQSIQFIAALVKCGRIQEDELDRVLQVLFPTKKPEEIDQLLSDIYGSAHTRSSSIVLNSSKPSSLEMKVIAQISPMPSTRNRKPRFQKPEDLDDLPPPEVAANLPPVILQGSKGFNLQNTLQKDEERSDGNTVPLGRVRLAPIDK